MKCLLTTVLKSDIKTNILCESNEHKSHLLRCADLVCLSIAPAVKNANISTVSEYFHLPCCNSSKFQQTKAHFSWLLVEYYKSKMKMANIVNKSYFKDLSDGMEPNHQHLLLLTDKRWFSLACSRVLLE